MARRGAPPKGKVKFRPYPKYPFPRIRGLRARLSPVRVVEGAAWTKGGPWSGLIVLLFLGRAAKRNIKRRPERLALDKLEPGQGIIITTAPRMSRRA
jgi:hypothetical protein